MRVLLLSQNPRDAEFFKAAAGHAQMPFHQIRSPEEVCDEISRDHAAILVASADDEGGFKNLESVIAEKIGLFSAILNPNLMFFVADSEFSELTWLPQSEIFGNFVQRTFTAENQQLVGRVLKLVGNSTNGQHEWAVQRFFGPESKTQTLRLTKSTQKQPLVESLKNQLLQIGFSTRIAAVIASAIDELVMNAIFDAPVDSTGKYIYLQTPRSTEFNLDEKSQVEFQVAFDGRFLGISVIDNFGSLDKKKLLRHMGKSYESEEYKIKNTVAGAGLGLGTVFKNCGGMIFECEMGHKTCVTIIFRKTDSYKDFKLQFRFLSALMYFGQ